jgi:hypothetical protein
MGHTGALRHRDDPIACLGASEPRWVVRPPPLMTCDFRHSGSPLQTFVDAPSIADAIFDSNIRLS